MKKDVLLLPKYTVIDSLDYEAVGQQSDYGDHGDEIINRHKFLIRCIFQGSFFRLLCLTQIQTVQL